MTSEEARRLVERQAAAWERADLDAIVADFAPDALFISPGGRWQGPAAIRGAAKAFFDSVGQVQVTITRVLNDGQQGAAEWTWSEQRRSTGQRHTAEDAIIFQVKDGQIVYWREYFDTANF
jgi:uncharacterized protein (TIGR02246 family)